MFAAAINCLKARIKSSWPAKVVLTTENEYQEYLSSMASIASASWATVGAK